MNAFEAALQQNIAYLERKLGLNTTTTTTTTTGVTNNRMWHVSNPCPMPKPTGKAPTVFPEWEDMDF